MNHQNGTVVNGNVNGQIGHRTKPSTNAPRQKVSSTSTQHHNGTSSQHHPNNTTPRHRQSTTTPRQDVNTPRQANNTPRHSSNTPRHGNNTPRQSDNTARHSNNTPRHGDGVVMRRKPGQHANSKKRHSLPDRWAHRRASTGAVPQDRVAMLVMEANEISDCLKKDYHFTRHSETSGAEEQTLIRVTNKKFGISCLWSVDKLKERLVKMRKLVYADDVASSCYTGESVFYDPQDAWEKVTVTTDRTFDVATDAADGLDAIDRAMRELSEQQQEREELQRERDIQEREQREQELAQQAKEAAQQRANNSFSNRRAPDLPRRPSVPRQRPSSAQAQVSSYSGHSTGSGASTDRPGHGTTTDHSGTSTDRNGTPLGAHSTHSERSGTHTDRPGSGTPQGVHSTHSVRPGSGTHHTTGSSTSSERPGSGRSGSGELPAESTFIFSPTGPGVNGDVSGILPEKYLTGSPRENIRRPASANTPASTASSSGSNNGVHQRHPNSHTQHPKSHVHHQNSDVQHQNSDVQHQNSDVQHQNSYQQNQDSYAQNQNQYSNTQNHHTQSHSSHTQIQNSTPNPRISPPPTTLTHATPQVTQTPNTSQRHTAAPSRLKLTTTSSHGYGLHNPRQRKAARTDAHTQTEPDNHKVALLTVCREMMRLTLTRVKGYCRGSEVDDDGRDEESLADRILISCESIKVAVINVLEAYTQTVDSPADSEAFPDSDLVRITAIQMVTSVELLVAQATLWVDAYSTGGDPLVTGVHTNMMKAVRELAAELLAFIQGCENRHDSQAHDSSARFFSLLYDLVRHTGELAMATAVCPTSLRDTGDDDHGNREEDIVHILPSSDLKQAFLSGVDGLVDHSLEGGLDVIESAERQAETYTTGDHDMGYADILKHVYIVIATSKLLLYKCREIQVELDTEMQEDCLRPDNYYYCYYQRCGGVTTHAGTLTDNIRLLVTATETLVSDPEPGVLRKVCRCAEMVQRTTSKLLQAASLDIHTSENTREIERRQRTQRSRPASAIVESRPRSAQLDLSFASSVDIPPLDLQSLTSDQSESSILSPEQHSQLACSTDDVKTATRKLIDLTQRELAKAVGQGQMEGKIRRMLPATPSNFRPVPRPKSARAMEKRRLEHNLSRADMDTSVETLEND